MHPNLFKNRYPREAFQGKAWLRNVSEEDRQAFGDIGNQAADRGKQGGRALVAKHPKKNKQGKNAHMAAIGRLGAAATKRKFAAIREAADEAEAAAAAQTVSVYFQSDSMIEF